MSAPKRGPGRPAGPDGPAVVKAVRIPEQLLARFDGEAAERGYTRSRAIIAALREWLSEPDPHPEAPNDRED